MGENKEGSVLVENHQDTKAEKLAAFWKAVKAYLTDDDLAKVEEAYELADKAHKEQKRASGEPYIIHPLAVATTLAELQIDAVTIEAGLLHDVVEDTTYTLEDISKEFGDTVAF